MDAAHWALRYRWRLIITDVLIVVVTVAASQILWFGIDRAQLTIGGNDENSLRLNYALVTVILVISWLVTLAAFDTRDVRIIGIGPLEYKRVFDASLRLFGLVAIAALIFKLDLARGYILTAFPAGVILLILTRWLWRQWLVKQRLAGRYSSRALLVGTLMSIKSVADQFVRFPYAGFHAVGICAPMATIGQADPDHPDLTVLGGVEDVAEVAIAHSVDSVILTSTDALTPWVVKRIVWSLESTGVDIAIAPALTDIAGPRIHTRPLAGLPLLHLEVPQYQGGAQWAKTTFDFLVALIAIILLSPLLLLIALLVKLTSKGPVFFRQERVGLNGTPFKIIKFRTMVKDAEELLPELIERNEGHGLLFKLKDDPRVTRLGRVLRRFSFDELPQFFNVLAGDMSVVGPRPPLPREVQEYEPEVHRRLLVKPGITGPWQISGRSNVAWEDGVRMDLYYVENWTLMGDLVLIWRTVKSVLTKHGAY